MKINEIFIILIFRQKFFFSQKTNIKKEKAHKNKYNNGTREIKTEQKEDFAKKIIYKIIALIHHYIAIKYQF